MKVADFCGVWAFTLVGECHVLWIALEMSLQYGVTDRGAASTRLFWNSASRFAG